MTTTLTARTATQPAATASFTEVDPCIARAEYFFDLELMELSATIPQAAPRGVTKY